MRADSERRLTKRCRELGGELVGSAAKVAAALRLGEDDAAAIAALKAEIEKAWRLVDASADKARHPSPAKSFTRPFAWSDGAQRAWNCAA